uniref:Uncharacterized protein n=1 Tax=Caenorhabditis japonica TaxID=281687 RepID=A0A8R1E6K6_CAEJA
MSKKGVTEENKAKNDVVVKSKPKTVEETDEDNSLENLSPISPPRVMNAKRKTDLVKDAKDPEYVTIDPDLPEFEKAILLGGDTTSTKEITKTTDATQPSFQEVQVKDDEAVTKN